eukprot:gnl/MRDRNA2_/MRDRNA2_115468_c0_seq1.p1 gnl/MRDRNA2_/MRDRNA2_115468_c0~~gnl/MRDRNA2_/MRDRNA2_115468_c0_seq1.p1  ORF type:complete len:320 (-),score=57.03 gnl/MRDRNA2_/MRDRNA2_115468_c0_seq1:108-1067(-)
MIYIFNGCQNSCRACGKACDHTCAPCLRVLDRPLGWYVAFSGIMNILVLAFAALALTDPSVKECSSPVFLFVLVDAGLAVLNIIFAFHAQNRLMNGMSDADLNQLTAGDIMARAWHLIVYDVGFCLYFFTFIGCMIWNVFGSSWTGQCNMDTSWASLCSVLGLMFVFLTIGLLFMYWFVLSCEDCCGGGSSSRRQQPATTGNVMMRMLLGNPSQNYGRHQAPMRQAAAVQGQPVQYGQPVQGQAVPQAAPTSGGYYGHPAPTAPPAQQQQQQATPAQQAMNVGAAVAGAGLNALGGLLSGAGKKMQGQGGQAQQGGVRK